jgi:hypothetical protein
MGVLHLWTFKTPIFKCPTYTDLKRNIQKVITHIPKEYMYNIINGAYKNRDVKYTSCNKTRKRKPKEYL